ncbi:MAG: 4-hydroxy-tetrahydrodipicolinate synthase [Methanomassiliicoccales archaeon]|jgi:4-hydroxy-tetrahydrodipicolinate synthase|nr:4-hydroxy-tetrahydrodipicolinate synthase [Methanomassiliicoccales archaeon]
MLGVANLKGIFVAIVTPFTHGDEVDVEGLRKLVDFYIKNGIHGIMTTGGNGEFPHLLPEERKVVLEHVVDAVRGRIPVIACTTGCSVKETILYTKHADNAGADAAIIVQPYYFKLPPEQIFRYYEAVANSTEIPIVVYNNPGYTKNPIPPKLMTRILNIRNVIGLKQSEYDISQTIEIIRVMGDQVSVMTGIDSQLFPALCIGAKGIFSTAACVIPKQMVELYETFMRGDVRKALEIHMKLQTINRFFEYDPGYVAPCKEALRLMGLPAGHVRPPLPELSNEERVQLKEALVNLGVLKN